jgi:GNAT superfamily N-acetyltransferase
MPDKASIEVRTLQPTDLPEALRLEASEGWNQTEADWNRIQKLCPQGCFAALNRGTLVGTVTTVTYRRDLAWIGMMLVKQDYRGRGIGKRLMAASLDYCDKSGIRTVKLDATPAGRPLYERFGFTPEATVERWQGVADRGSEKGRELLGLSDSVRQALYKVDQQAFGSDRRELLDRLITDACFEPAAVADSSSPRFALAGFALARRGLRAFYAGPIIAIDRSVAVALLDVLLARLHGQTVYFDLLVDSDGDTKAAKDRGFVKQRSLTRMYRGQPISAGTSKLIFAIAGPELG